MESFRKTIIRGRRLKNRKSWSKTKKRSSDFWMDEMKIVNLSRDFGFRNSRKDIKEMFLPKCAVLNFS